MAAMAVQDVDYMDYTYSNAFNAMAVVNNDKNNMDILPTASSDYIESVFKRALQNETTQKQTHDNVVIDT
ncbi:hypothetical protein N7528_003104 [Penicillium herquei]|nr:hypothetical protein N7528_003104 [Penicillium herquei]